MLPPRNRAAERELGFREPLEMRSCLEPAASKPVIEVTTLKWISEIVRLRLAVKILTAAPADHLKLRAGRWNFCSVIEVRDPEFLKTAEARVCERLAWFVWVRNVHAVPAVAVLGAGAAMDSHQLD